MFLFLDLQHPEQYKPEGPHALICWMKDLILNARHSAGDITRKKIDQTLALVKYSTGEMDCNHENNK